MIFELITDIRRLLFAKKVMRMMIKFHENRLMSSIELSVENKMVFSSEEIEEIRMRTRFCIEREESHYKYAKGEIAYKWKKKLGIKEEYL